MARERLLALLAVMILLGGCFGNHPPPVQHVELVEEPSLTAFLERATAFYEHLSGRRVNSFDAYNDPALRAAFRDTQRFVDYYAQFVYALSEQHFERNQPNRVEVEEFVVDGPGRIRARIRVSGDNGLPLRWWTVSLVREDHWSYSEGNWWLDPTAP